MERFDVSVRGRDELEQDVLHVLAHVARLGERRGVCDGKRHLEEARERLGKQRLARARGAQQQDVALRELDGLAVHDLIGAGRAGAGLEALVVLLVLLVLKAIQHAAVVVVDGHAHGALGVLLAHDVLRQLVIDLVRRGQVLDGQRRGGGVRGHVTVGIDHVGVKGVGVADDVRAGVDALVADEDALRALDELADLAAGLSTERAADLVLVRVARVVVGWHGYSSLAASTRRVMTLSTRPYSHASAARR